MNHLRDLTDRAQLQTRGKCIILLSMLLNELFSELNVLVYQQQTNRAKVRIRHATQRESRKSYLRNRALSTGQTFVSPLLTYSLSAHRFSSQTPQKLKVGLFERLAWPVFR